MTIKTQLFSNYAVKSDHISHSLETLFPENKVHDEKVTLILALTVPQSIITTLNRFVYNASVDYIIHQYHISTSIFIPIHYCNLIEELTTTHMSGSKR
jgi:hypothetical protein